MSLRCEITVWLFLLLALTGRAAESGSAVTPAVTAVKIEYWNAFTGVTTHFFLAGRDGGFSLSSTILPPDAKRTAKATHAVLAQQDLASLVTFVDDLKTEKTFANLKFVTMPDGESVEVTVFRNSFSRSVSSQFAFDKDGSEAEKKLGVLVTALLKKANASLDETEVWGHTIVPKVQIAAKNWEEAVTQIVRLRDENEHEIPCQVYTVAAHVADKRLEVSGERLGMESILKQFASQAGLTVAMFGPIAVAGSREEVARFAQGLETQQYTGELGYRRLHRLAMRGAVLTDVVNFLNRHLGQNDLTVFKPTTLKCLGHETYRVNFEGTEVKIGPFLSAIAAAVRVPTGELFSESKTEPKTGNTK